MGTGVDIAAPPGPAQLAARLSPIEITGNTTATIDRLHIVTATATISDPSPSQARGYEVIVRNGTATIGGTAYGAGLKIRRYYHSGAWANAVEPSQGGTPTTGRHTEWDASGNLVNSQLADTVSGGVLTIAGALLADITATIPPMSGRWRLSDYRTGAFTAVIGGEHRCAGTFTVTDPSSPSAGDDFMVIVISGTITVGGTAYATAGTLIRRMWDGAAWTNRVVPHIGAAWTWGGVQTFPAGSAAAPSAAFVDAGLGFYRVSANVLGVSTSGVARYLWDGTGRVTHSLNSLAITSLNNLATVLDLHGADGVACQIGQTTYGAGVVSVMLHRKANGTAAAPTQTLSGETLARWGVRGRGSTAWQTTNYAAIDCVASANLGDATGGLEWRIFVSSSADASGQECARLYSDRGVQIGGTYGTSPGAGGLKTGGARVVIKRAIVSAAATTAIAATDHFVVVTGATTHTLTLPAAVDGQLLFIKNRSTGTVTVNRAGADTIDGGTTFNLTAGQGTTLICNGTDWCRVSNA